MSVGVVTGSPPRPRRAARAESPVQLVGRVLPALALVAMFVVCAVIEPNVLSATGVGLLFGPAVPLILAGMSQMFVIAVGDIDLGNGFLIGLVTAVSAVHLASNPLLALGILLGVAVLYVGQAVLVQLRGIPSIVVTLGASFVWLGIGLVLLPVPGGQAPSWLSSVMNLATPRTATYDIVVPMPLIFAVVTGLVGWLIAVRWPYGAVIRAVGSNADTVRRTGWSVLRARMAAYGLAALFAVLAGLALSGVISAGDPTTSANYTLLSVAAVILGGGQFSGGRAVPVGVVIGALAISLVTSMLSLLTVSSNYQTGVQGVVLVAVLAGRALTERRLRSEHGRERRLRSEHGRERRRRS